MQTLGFGACRGKVPRSIPPEKDSGAGNSLAKSPRGTCKEGGGGGGEDIEGKAAKRGKEVPARISRVSLLSDPGGISPSPNFHTV